MSYDPLKRAAASRRRNYATRWLLTFGLVLNMALAAKEAVWPGDPQRLFPDTWLMLWPVIIASFLSPYARAPILSDRGFQSYDEFERAALLIALRRAYLVVLLAVVAVFGWLTVGARLGLALPTLPRQWSAIGFALMFLMLTLPATFAEFMVPMPDPDDEPI